MVSLKAHFDGTAIVLDEPATLVRGQEVLVVVKPLPDITQNSLPTLSGFGRGTFKVSDDFNEPLEEFSEYQ